MINTNLISELFEKDITQLHMEEKNHIREVIEQLDQGKIRVCEKSGSGWITNEWIKKAILLFFRIQKMEVIELSHNFNFVDKIPVKKWTGNEGVRVVPSCVERRGLGYRIIARCRRQVPRAGD